MTKINLPSSGPDYAERFRSSVDEFISFVEPLDDVQWNVQTDLEGWPVGVIAHHLAVGAQFVSDLVLSVADGGEIGWTMDFIDDVNAQHAEVFATISKQEALEALELQTAGAVEKIKGLSESQLGRRVEEPMPYGEGSLGSAREIIQTMLIDHLHSHLDSIKTSISKD